MMSTNNFANSFTKTYPLSKSLRFELRPIDEAGEEIKDFESEYFLKMFKLLRETVVEKDEEKETIIDEDEELAKKYQQIKPLIDDYHRAYISEKLVNPSNKDTGELYINADNFEQAFKVYQAIGRKPNKKDLEQKEYDKEIKKWQRRQKDWQKEQTALRKKIKKCFDGNKDLFEKSLFTKLLPNFLEDPNNKWEANEENKKLVESFNKFTTYFKGLNENRKNMYVSDEKSTAIGYRLINENLPRFFRSYINYAKMTKKHSGLKFQIEPALLKKLAQLNVNGIDEVFKPSFFMNLLTQEGIDLFNELRGGRAEEDRTTHSGLNVQLNLYRQKNEIKAKDLPDFEKLHKQILSQSKTVSFIPKAFASDVALLDELKKFDDMVKVDGKDNLLGKLDTALQQLGESNLEKIYLLGGVGINNISYAIFNRDWNLVNRALADQAEKEYPQIGKKITNKIVENRENFCKKDLFSLSELDQIVSNYLNRQNETNETRKQDWEKAKKDWKLKDLKHPLSTYFLNIIDDKKQALKNKIAETKPLFDLKELDQDRRTPDPEKEQDQGGKGYQQVQQIHTMLDAFMDLLHGLKPLHLVKNRKSIAPENVDTGFYSPFSESFEKYSNVFIPLYNTTRNYLTKKPYRTEKFKLTFTNPTLLGGWDVNKESDNLGVILRKKGLYYLAIMSPNSDKKLFKQATKVGKGEYCYEKINYKQVANASKDIQNLMVIDGKTVRKTGKKDKKDGINYKLEELKNKYLPKEINHIRISKTYSKSSDNFNGHDLVKFIKYYQLRAEEYFTYFKFNFKSPNDYADFNEFTDHIDSQGYQISFADVASQHISDAVKAGKLFLFKIYNKDFSPHSKGAKNLHTLYWQGLFEQGNLKDVVLKLNGKAELFFRRKSITYSGEIMKSGHHHNDPKKKQPYAIIKDRRYTQDKFLFHVPITLNFKQTAYSNFNDKVNKTIQNDSNVNIIGIDRGERHLLYYSVINQKAEIIEQASLNTIDTGGKGYIVDYQDKLDKREKERDDARKSWGTIENIKELKAGYLSQVVHKLAKLIIKHNAIVCLEDLNSGFKRGRFGIEKQVYQKFERALIEKLNYLVFKDAKEGQAGHYLNAYQLTTQFESFKKLGKQSGILYYVPAAYTSVIDPATGFINFLNTRYETKEKAELFFGKMDAIRYNKEAGYFEFKFDYDKFEVKQNLEDYQTKWIACTYGGCRYLPSRNQETGKWDVDTINVTDKLRDLFKENNITYEQGEDIKDAICDRKKSVAFFTELLRLLRLTLTLRHSHREKGEDFILSPVKDKNGKFFDSRNASKDQPKDADANGAYHIALKGLWNLERIKAWDGKKKINLYMNNNDWFRFVEKLKQQSD